MKLFSLSVPLGGPQYQIRNQRLNIGDLRFHDLRHEAILRLFEKGLSAPQVAAISGHQDYRMLARYVHPHRFELE